MFNTVTFGTLNSYTDLDLVLTSKTVGSAEPKTNTVEVPGADGVIDLTEYFGEVVYSNRTLTFEFQTLGDYEDVYGTVQNAIHGQKMKIFLSDDPNFYYIGRVSVSEWKSDKTVGEITIEADCEPYKYRTDVTSRTVTVTDSATEVFTNLRKKVVPTFTFSADMGIEFGGNTYQASAGDWSNSAVTFVQGDNTVKFTGTGTVTVKYQERGL